MTGEKMTKFPKWFGPVKLFPIWPITVEGWMVSVAFIGAIVIIGGHDWSSPNSIFIRTSIASVYSVVVSLTYRDDAAR